ncbi:hypothetical protein L484_006500 [Morus notabilis]|uniref:Uncharacterized protein n=1 Tax=Morus notabilis TaxID=981085 RepID=W9SNN5_9ROSA|nr:hypothetical protein L484_006500 [Morus notabilis]
MYYKTCHPQPIRGSPQRKKEELFEDMEVLGTPEFRTCKASHEIRKDVELLMDLYKQMILELNKPAGKALPEYCSARPGSMPILENKRQKLSQRMHFVQKEIEDGFLKTDFSSEKKKAPTGSSSRLAGSYIIGGSVSGWNFITFGGNKPVYNGVTKKAFRSSHKEVRIMEASVNN